MESIVVNSAINDVTHELSLHCRETGTFDKSRDTA